MAEEDEDSCLFFNRVHWMESIFLDPLFCLKYFVRVVLCVSRFAGVANWQTECLMLQVASGVMSF
jgi:hypothetical protein